MFVLGVSGHYHDSAAALLADGELVAAAEEERFTRRKHEASFPEAAIDFVLREGAVRREDVAAVAWYEHTGSKLGRIRSSAASAGVSRRVLRSVLRPRFVHEQDLARRFGDRKRRVPIMAISHHMAHAAAAFYPSPFESAAVVTLDGVGEWATTSIGHGRGANVDLLRTIAFPHSLGLLYSAFTAYCGFRVNSGEYKLMGLAPYGKPRFRKVIYDELVTVA